MNDATKQDIKANIAKHIDTEDMLICFGRKYITFRSSLTNKCVKKEAKEFESAPFKDLSWLFINAELLIDLKHL